MKFIFKFLNLFFLLISLSLNIFLSSYSKYSQAISAFISIIIILLILNYCKLSFNSWIFKYFIPIISITFTTLFTKFFGLHFKIIVKTPLFPEETESFSNLIYFSIIFIRIILPSVLSYYMSSPNSLILTLPSFAVIIDFFIRYINFTFRLYKYNEKIINKSEKINVSTISVDKTQIINNQYFDNTYNISSLIKKMWVEFPSLLDKQLPDKPENDSLPIFENFQIDVFGKYNRRLIDLTEEMAKNGSKLIFWSEANAIIVNRVDELKFILTFKGIAEKYSCHVGVTFGVFYNVQNAPYFRNKILIFGADGDSKMRVLKRFPIINLEKSLLITEDTDINIYSSKQNSKEFFLSSALGNDRFLLDSQADADILLVTQANWRELDIEGLDLFQDYFDQILAVEKGYSIIRNSRGKSLSTTSINPIGEKINSLNTFQINNEKEEIIVNTFQIPLKGIKPLNMGYSTLGLLIFCGFVSSFSIGIFLANFLIGEKSSKKTKTKTD
ncbi:hypothetical protein M0811_10436 [Anaeramoeba ignava]|uniref:Uncharacterized protein n=1 Tax=Anaeramoeba ignava TaxID=1746090 RepID=A0A9Q0LFE1_ANAIG|nr:hypothetical protein M0811_10436 [Anaeramoeba ignava]